MLKEIKKRFLKCRSQGITIAEMHRATDEFCESGKLPRNDDLSIAILLAHIFLDRGKRATA